LKITDSISAVYTPALLINGSSKIFYGLTPGEDWLAAGTLSFRGAILFQATTSV
jgi:hypothetical protein